MRSPLRSLFQRHRSAIGVAALVVLTAPLGVSRRPLWVENETREAAIAKQMADSGDFFQTRSVEFGMTPMAAIQSATVHAAEMLGISGQLGVVAPGTYADIIAVPGDPLKDVKELEHVIFVMKDGKGYKTQLRSAATKNLLLGAGKEILLRSG